MRTSLCFLCYTKRDKRASIRVDNATCNLLFFFFSFLFSLRFSIVNTNLFREPSHFVFVTLSQTHPCTQATEFNYSILNFSLSKPLFIKKMARSQQEEDVSDNESPLDYTHDTTTISQEASYKSTTFKPRKSVIDNQTKTTFWSISSFSETSS